MKEFNYKKIILILIIILLILNNFIINKVYGASYDLNDYKNCNLMDGVWCIVHARNNDEIYLITGERADYRYIITGKKINEDGTIYSTGDFFTVRENSSSWSNAQGAVYVYTFNKETSKFENRTGYGIGNQCFKCGECDIIASGVDLYSAGAGNTSFFQQTPVPFKVFMGQLTLAETLEKAQAVEQMKKTIIGFLKYLIVFVILVIAFWKGWQFLLKNLKSA